MGRGIKKVLGTAPKIGGLDRLHPGDPAGGEKRPPSTRENTSFTLLFRESYQGRVDAPTGAPL